MLNYLEAFRLSRRPDDLDRVVNELDRIDRLELEDRAFRR